MGLSSRLETDFKQAMLTKDQALTGLLRLVKSALKNESIKLKKAELTDQEITKVLKSEAKKRQEAIKLYTQGGRSELAEKEEKELELIKKYLPEEMSQDEIKKVVEQLISQMGEVTAKDFGRVMSSTMAKLKGKADGGLVSQVVKEMLNPPKASQ